MKKIIYIVVGLLILLVGQQAKATKYSTDAVYKKVLVKDKIIDFAANKVLHIDNERGSITIKNWDKPKVSITVELVSDIRSKSKLKRMENGVRFEIFEDGWKYNSKSTGHFSLRNESYGFNYTIYAPKNLRVDLETRFGDVWIESIHNHSKIDGEFVSLQLETTEGEGPLELSLKFAEDVQLGELASLDLEAKFSSLAIEQVGHIETDTQFSKIKIAGKTPKADVSSKHDKMEWDAVVNLVAKEMEFSTLFIEKMLKKLELEDVRFGKIRINEVGEAFEDIAIDAEFTPIRIGLGESAYELELESEFGKVNLPEDVEVYIRNKKMNSLYLKGGKQGKGKKGKLKLRNKHAKIEIK